MKKRIILLSVVGAGFAALYLANASWLAPRGEAAHFIAHRGVHQTFDVTGVGPDDCTATRIRPVEHTFIENTLPAIEAAFAAGARRVEIDIHPTTDGEFAVFHDWTLDCRTDGQGVTRQHSMAQLRRLDAGHGYTADGGETWPLRGQGIGQIPSLAEVLSRFPDGEFVINIKSNNPEEATWLDTYLTRHNANRNRLTIFAAERPRHRLAALDPSLRVIGRGTVKACATQYMAIGWSGIVPEACHDTVLVLPVNYAPWAWGWPRRLEQRLREAGSEVWLIGPMDPASPNASGIDSRDLLDAVPADFSGGIFTNRIERVGPHAWPEDAG